MDFHQELCPGVLGNDFYYYKLHTLRQLSTVTRYKDQFQFLQGLVSMTHPQVDEAYFASCCLKGLKEEIRNVVQLFRPETVSHVLSLAGFQESILADEAKMNFPNSNDLINEESVLADSVEKCCSSPPISEEILSSQPVIVSEIESSSDLCDQSVGGESVINDETNVDMEKCSVVIPDSVDAYEESVVDVINLLEQQTAIAEVMKSVRASVIQSYLGQKFGHVINHVPARDLFFSQRLCESGCAGNPKRMKDTRRPLHILVEMETDAEWVHDTKVPVIINISSKWPPPALAYYLVTMVGTLEKNQAILSRVLKVFLVTAINEILGLQFIKTEKFHSSVWYVQLNKEDATTVGCLQRFQGVEDDTLIFDIEHRDSVFDHRLQVDSTITGYANLGQLHDLIASVSLSTFKLLDPQSLRLIGATQAHNWFNSPLADAGQIWPDLSNWVYCSSKCQSIKAMDGCCISMPRLWLTVVYSIWDGCLMFNHAINHRCARRWKILLSDYGCLASTIETSAVNTELWWTSSLQKLGFRVPMILVDSCNKKNMFDGEEVPHVSSSHLLQYADIYQRKELNMSVSDLVIIRLNLCQFTTRLKVRAVSISRQIVEKHMRTIFLFDQRERGVIYVAHNFVAYDSSCRADFQWVFLCAILWFSSVIEVDRFRKISWFQNLFTGSACFSIGIAHSKNWISMRVMCYKFCLKYMIPIHLLPPGSAHSSVALLSIMAWTVPLLVCSNYSGLTIDRKVFLTHDLPELAPTPGLVTYRRISWLLDSINITVASIVVRGRWSFDPGIEGVMWSESVVGEVFFQLYLPSYNGCSLLSRGGDHKLSYFPCHNCKFRNLFIFIDAEIRHFVGLDHFIFTTFKRQSDHLACAWNCLRHTKIHIFAAHGFFTERINTSRGLMCNSELNFTDYMDCDIVSEIHWDFRGNVSSSLEPTAVTHDRWMTDQLLQMDAWGKDAIGYNGAKVAGSSYSFGFALSFLSWSSSVLHLGEHIIHGVTVGNSAPGAVVKLHSWYLVCLGDVSIFISLSYSSVIACTWSSDSSLQLPDNIILVNQHLFAWISREIAVALVPASHIQLFNNTPYPTPTSSYQAGTATMRSMARTIILVIGRCVFDLVPYERAPALDCHTSTMIDKELDMQVSISRQATLMIEHLKTAAWRLFSLYVPDQPELDPILWLRFVIDPGGCPKYHILFMVSHSGDPHDFTLQLVSHSILLFTDWTTSILATPIFQWRIAWVFCYKADVLMGVVTFMIVLWCTAWIFVGLCDLRVSLLDCCIQLVTIPCHRHSQASSTGLASHGLVSRTAP